MLTQDFATGAAHGSCDGLQKLCRRKRRSNQVWRSDFNDPRGLGGDQIQMALSSWRLLYAYSGNERVKENMKFLADYYLSHGLSPANCKWPNIPFPYNTLIYF